VLHHPGYRTKFADNLKRELPRIPLAPPCDPSPERKRRVKGGGPVACAPGSDGSADLVSGFSAFAKAGKRLAKLHIEYESLEPWPLEWIETHDEPLSYRVEKMQLSKDKKSIEVNDSPPWRASRRRSSNTASATAAPSSGSSISTA